MKFLLIYEIVLMALHVLTTFVVSNVNLKKSSWNTTNGQTYLNNHDNMSILMMSWNKPLNHYFNNVLESKRCTYLQCSKVYNDMTIVLGVENFQQGADAIRKRKYTSSPKQVYDRQNAIKKYLCTKTSAIEMSKSTSKISSTPYKSAFKIIMYSNKLENCNEEVIASVLSSNKVCELCKRPGASVGAMKFCLNHIGTNAEQVCCLNILKHKHLPSTRKTLTNILQLPSKTVMLNNNNKKIWIDLTIKHILKIVEWTNDNSDLIIMVQWICACISGEEALLTQMTILGKNAHDEQLNCKSVVTPMFVYAKHIYFFQRRCIQRHLCRQHNTPHDMDTNSLALDRSHIHILPLCPYLTIHIFNVQMICGNNDDVNDPLTIQNVQCGSINTKRLLSIVVLPSYFYFLLLLL
ncbi:hypothetical protein RFI_22918 [Reticulomyxa filosa]|uniref:Uncharacterized protein n=1 Tax=Reticulomyxa filosa TaxID=46433 RepID=X6MMZ9_RETFI|nr:hypothetical protein RFI_22918 [Reticulomyxa filosa]|eukprot:ETO14450.1 hypothetical protein RFI_22918 [Reticulomyxa filosa]